VLVDETPPIVQARRAEVRADEGGAPTVRIEWSAYDEFFPPRPIELAYRSPSDANWTVLAGSVANIGRFDGALPASLVGAVSFRVVARDRVGHVATSELSPVTVEPAAPAPRFETASFAPTVPEPSPEDADVRAPLVSAEAARQAQKLLEYGNWFLLRGQLDVASERFRETLELDPANRDALINLAGIDYRRGQTGRSIESYLTLLKYHRGDVAALRGLALAYVAEKRYASAAESLEQILARIGDEPRTRIELGDVLLLSGQRSEAFAHWNAVAREPGLTPDLIRDVQLRLQTYSASSR
jgi:Tfp pilus assembly protein PilF